MIARHLGDEWRQQRCGKGGGLKRWRRCADSNTGKEKEAEVVRNCIAGSWHQRVGTEGEE